MTSPQPLREPRRCARRPRCVSRPRDAAPAVQPRAALGRCYADASSFVVPTSALATSAQDDVVGSIPSAAPLPKDPTAVTSESDPMHCRISANQNRANLNLSSSSSMTALPFFDQKRSLDFVSLLSAQFGPSCRVPWQTDGEDARGSKPTPSHGDRYEAPPDNPCGDGVAPGRGGGG